MSVITIWPPHSYTVQCPWTWKCHRSSSFTFLSLAWQPTISDVTPAREVRCVSLSHCVVDYKVIKRSVCYSFISIAYLKFDWRLSHVSHVICRIFQSLCLVSPLLSYILCQYGKLMSRVILSTMGHISMEQNNLNWISTNQRRFLKS